MKLRGIDFGCILCASGAMGFFGEKYRHQKLLGPLGPNFNGCTFVAKTTTLQERKGNMPMQKDGITPKEFKPKCIKAKFLKGIMLNAVGLSGPGANALFETGRWQRRTNPFFLSFMSVAPTPKERIKETRLFMEMFKQYLPGFQTKVGLQINVSCPNTELDPDELVFETEMGLEIVSELGVPIVPKFNVLAPVEAVKKIAQSPNCDAICISNTIPWGKFPEYIDWKKLFGTNVSPLAEFGGGGLSGKPLLYFVADWIHGARCAGIEKPINAGGGILYPNDLGLLRSVGASSVFIGSVATLRPWKVAKIIKKANQLFQKGETS